MNDPIKQRIVGASIAGFCLAAGVLIGWKLKSETMAANTSSAVQAASRVTPRDPFGPQVIYLSNPTHRLSSASVLPAPVVGSNPAFRPPAQLVEMPRFSTTRQPSVMTYAAKQTAQNLSEVKQARVDMAEAQRKFEEMKKAIAKQSEKTAANTNAPVVAPPSKP